MSNEQKRFEPSVPAAHEEEQKSHSRDVRRRSIVSDNDDEELDEFGRVKRRREKFKRERSEERDQDKGENDRDRKEDRYQHRRHRRRSSSSGSRSPRRSHRRRHSNSDSDYEHSRGESRHRHRHRSYRNHHNYRGGADLYSEAAQYIDTEFYPTKVYIGDLENVTESEIESAFSRFGPLESVKIVEGKDYGFITFEKNDAALSAIQNMHGALLGARHIKVNRAKIPERNKVGFGNVPWQDEDGLMAKEASFDGFTRRRSSTIIHLDDSNYATIDPAAAAIPRRVLTSYDDL
ncbi:hypothetical protein [Parasitella parasitica]|uniref:RRM domain-containing protein n=1 Tax=Parasitella parasitica TaxID=35722 RepID=A0A0B7N6A2_9FUNG|nr:hypothetical protein [Parasitella parasitica]